eukprot:gnl/MRDRNA2_/MRDRNA2_30467_c0_seq1.p1 gnl/MRDRNA2_/MRDRNA2_30467_c0~~gnl/MRDRNA2_/MRDRNA2_30467_c0_seq1.p1  ORF type:complete len:383 (-),score=82.52 gnl/MRDRNA2_/MRDRNA2_30467_c0_seq1:37-1185(-)
MLGTRRLQRSAVVWCVVSIFRPSKAWDANGHERIARIATPLLHGKHKDQIRSMMHGDLIDLAGWEKEMTAKHPETEGLHWHRQTPEWECTGFHNAHLGDEAGHVRCDEHGAQKGSLFCALGYFFDHFAHDALLKEYPEPKEPLDIPQSLEALAKVPPLELGTKQYLRWLVVLIGDLHQPLHWLKEHDYGREQEINYKGERYNLLEFWETFVTARPPRTFPELPPTSEIEAQYAKEHDHWKHLRPTELFREWAKEVAASVCHDVYAAMEVNHADGSRKLENPFELTEELLETWIKLAEKMLMQAGLRTAFILEDIIEHRRHKHAHAEGKGRHHHRKKWTTNLFYNVCLLVIVLPTILCALRYHEANSWGKKVWPFGPADTKGV